MAPDFFDLVHWVFSAILQNVHRGLLKWWMLESEGYVRLWERGNLQWEAEVSKCDPLSRTIQL